MASAGGSEVVMESDGGEFLKHQNFSQSTNKHCKGTSFWGGQPRQQIRSWVGRVIGGEVEEEEKEEEVGVMTMVGRRRSGSGGKVEREVMGGK